MKMEEKLLVIILELTRATNTILVVEGIEESVWQVFDRYAGNFYLVATSDKDIASENVKNIKVDEPSGKDLLMILISGAVALEDKHRISFDYNALLTVINASRNYYAEKTQPERALLILEKIAQSAGAGYQKNVDSVAVAKFVAQEKGIPYTHILK